MMKKISLVGLALVAVCAFGALSAVSAFAVLTYETAQWLVAGVQPTAPVAADTLGELLFENTKLVANFLCSGLFEGTVGPAGLATVTAVFNLAGTLIEELDPSTATGGLSCVADGNQCANGTEIWPVNLPFLSVVMLDVETGLFYALVVKNANGLNPAYKILCLVGILSIEQLCEAVELSEAELLNVAGGVEPMGAIAPNGNCASEAGVALVENDPGGLITSTGGALTVSE
jgi:hypothetical protein